MRVRVLGVYYISNIVPNINNQHQVHGGNDEQEMQEVWAEERCGGVLSSPKRQARSVQLVQRVLER